MRSRFVTWMVVGSAAALLAGSALAQTTPPAKPAQRAAA